MKTLISSLMLVFLSWLLTTGLRHYGLARSLLGIPNGCSSCNLPTPRDGGVAMVLAFLFGLLPLAYAPLLLLTRGFQAGALETTQMHDGRCSQ